MLGVDSNGTGSSFYQEATRWEWRIGGMLVLIVGSIGNILSVAVFSRRSMRRSHVSIFFAALGITDFIALIEVAVRNIARFGFGDNYGESSSAVCKVLYFTHFWMTESSVWILVVLTVDRTWAVCRPHSRFHLGHQSAKWALISIYIFSCSANVHVLYGLGLNTETMACDFTTEDSGPYKIFVDHVWEWLDLIKYSALPALILIVCDILLILTIRRTQKSLSSVASHRSSRRVNRSVIVMLVATAVQHMLTTMPVVFAGWVTNTGREGSSVTNEPNISFIHSTLELIHASNNGLNFFTYCLSGRKFRDNLRGMLGRTPTSCDSNGTERFSQTLSSRSNCDSAISDRHVTHM